MIEKTIKTVTVMHLKQITETHDMLLKQQMKKHQNHFTETVLDLLIN